MKRPIPPRPPLTGGAPLFLSRIISCALLLVLLLPMASVSADISDYRVIRQAVTDASGELRLAIRSYRSDGVAHLLVVDPASLTTADLPAATLAAADVSLAARLGDTRFAKILARYTAAPYRLQNGGATRAQSAPEGVFLTVDLCPSKRPFERELFEAAERHAAAAPVPVTIFVSGVWLEKHPDEVAYLKREVAAGRLAITWGNHSFHHTYDPKEPLDRNFVLTAGTDFTAEVLDLEKALLAHGLLPSPFFRYPGLVSDARTMAKLRELSLIPIGADAWLAKGESPRKGSFILVHGNGNEPKGVQLFLPMLKEKSLRLLPITSAFGE